MFHKGGLPSISYDDALDEALCCGWIDSMIKRIDDRSYVRKFTPRRPGSVWSSSNVERVSKLRKEGRMTASGMEAFRKRTGEKSQLERISSKPLAIPRDLIAALKKDKTAWTNFEKFASSYRKRYLIWIAGAKQPKTRAMRIAEAVRLIAKNTKNLLK